MPTLPLDPYCLDQVRRELEVAGTLTREQQVWLLEEAERLYRANIALDSAQETHDRIVHDRDAELMGFQSEVADLLEKLGRMEQKLEIQGYELGFLRRRSAHLEPSEVNLTLTRPAPTS